MSSTAFTGSDGTQATKLHNQHSSAVTAARPCTGSTTSKRATRRPSDATRPTDATTERHDNRRLSDATTTERRATERRPSASDDRPSDDDRGPSEERRRPSDDDRATTSQSERFSFGRFQEDFLRFIFSLLLLLLLFKIRAVLCSFRPFVHNPSAFRPKVPQKPP